MKNVIILLLLSSVAAAGERSLKTFCQDQTLMVHLFHIRDILRKKSLGIIDNAYNAKAKGADFYSREELFKKKREKILAASKRQPLWGCEIGEVKQQMLALDRISERSFKNCLKDKSPKALAIHVGEGPARPTAMGNLAVQIEEAWKLSLERLLEVGSVQKEGDLPKARCLENFGSVFSGAGESYSQIKKPGDRCAFMVSYINKFHEQAEKCQSNSDSK